MKKQSVLRLLSLMFLAFTMGQPAHSSGFFEWLRGLYNQGRSGDRFYSELTATAVGDGKVYVHWPIGNEEQPTAEQLENIGSYKYSEPSPDDDTANAGVHGWGESDDYADHYYLLYAEPHQGCEIEGVYSDESCTTAYNFGDNNIFDGEGYKGYRVTIRSTESTNRENATKQSLYVRFVLNVTIGPRGYSTLYYSRCNFTVPTGVTATTYKLGDGYGKLEESRVYSAGDVIPAGEPVVLEGTAGQKYQFYPVNTTLNVADPDNILLGTDDAEQTASGYDEYFILSYNNTKGVVGFYWKNSDGSGFTNGAHKAYLALGGASGVKGFDLDGDNATGIDNVSDNLNLNDGPVFNLAGQRIGKMQKGINIVNGKKIMVK